jgi:hypothetical protein
MEPDAPDRLTVGITPPECMAMLVLVASSIYDPAFIFSITDPE